MEFLKLPELLTGDWDNVLILTYGANLPFFENSLWRQFSPRCRNKIILADARCYLDACKRYREEGLVRFLNQKYVVDGIFIPHSAHAKLIFLTNREKGRIIVGSGNLGIDGYASGGELFTHYEYSEKTPETYPIFFSAWEFVQELINRGYVGSSAIPYIHQFHSRTPWLFQKSTPEATQIRHNLSTNFLSQIKEAAQGEDIDEILVMAPFYDEKAYALKQLLITLKPKKLILFVQSGRTSVDPNAIKEVLDSFSGKSQIHNIGLKEDSANTYIHAKLILIKTKQKAICFQGSANLSQVALLLAAPAGNIELANLRIGKRDEFDYLLENLEIASETSAVSTLNLSFAKPEKEEISETGWYLTGGSWQGNILVLNFQGELADLSKCVLKIGSSTFPINLRYRGEKSFDLVLSDEAKALLGSPNPVTMVVNSGEFESNPVYVSNIASLNHEMLEEVIDEQEIKQIGDLNLEDESLERLLGELEATLVFDRRSVWRMSGKSLPNAANEDEEADHLDYLDVDYDLLRQHPKILQYLHRFHGGDPNQSPKSRLQIILNAITDHFNGLVSLASGTKVVASITEVVEGESAAPETEEEQQEEDEEKQRRQKSARARVRLILKNFLKRYIRGIKAPDFQELAGPDVMARNYIIFSHLLWRLLAKDWVETEFIVDSFLQIWGLFWGNLKNPGYFSKLDEKEKQQVTELLQQHHQGGLLIAAIYFGSYSSCTTGWEDVRFCLRDFFRYFISGQQMHIGEVEIADAWYYIGSLFPYHTPIPSKVVAELSRLIHFENQKSFLRSIERTYGYPEGSCSIEKPSVFRKHLNNAAMVECLVIKSTAAIDNINTAFAVVRDWEHYRPQDYYRIISSHKAVVFFFDVVAKEGHYFKFGTDEDIQFSEVPETTEKQWDRAIGEISSNALEADNKVKFVSQTSKENYINQIGEVA